MKSVWGHHVQISLFGESHGAAIGAVITGLAPGIPVDAAFMAEQLAKRKPRGAISTPRREADQPEIVSGLYQGRTTGTPLCLLIRNQNQHSGDYEATRFLPRPSHADYAAFAKYNGFQDPRGGGHFSGRLTAPLVAAGAICLQVLAAKGVRIGSHIARLQEISDRPFSSQEEALGREIAAVNQQYFPTLEEEAARTMEARILAAHEQGDSVGGVLETAVTGLPAGVGEPFFDSCESVLAQLLFSIPGVKGVAFGLGFGFADLPGSQANDPFYYDQGGQVRTRSNHNGGINGGVTNGMPLLFHTAVRPTPSIYQEQDTVDLAHQQNVKLRLTGRHDPAIIHRARVVVDSVTALGLLDLLVERWGTLWMV